MQSGGDQMLTSWAASLVKDSEIRMGKNFHSPAALDC